MTEIGSNCPAELRLWLTQAVQYDASDLHVVSGYPPMVRRHGELRRLDSPIIDHSKLAANLLPFLTESMRNQLEKGKNLDFSMSLPGEDGAQRFRVNYFYAARSLCGCFRVIPREIPSLEWAEFPSEVAERLCDYRNGLVLFSGVTGSGKSTSLAMIINTINQRGGSRIITVEEPVEYLFPQSPGSSRFDRQQYPHRSRRWHDHALGIRQAALPSGPHHSAHGGTIRKRPEFARPQLGSTD